MNGVRDTGLGKKLDTNRSLSARELLQRAGAVKDNAATPYTSGANMVSAVPKVARRMNSNPLDDMEDDLLDTLNNESPVKNVEDRRNSAKGHIRAILNKLDLSNVLIAQDEDIKFACNCTVVSGLEAIEAIFVVTESDLIIVEGYQLDDDGITLNEIQKTEVKWDYTIDLCLIQRRCGEK